MKCEYDSCDDVFIRFAEAVGPISGLHGKPGVARMSNRVRRLFASCGKAELWDAVQSGLKPIPASAPLPDQQTLFEEEDDALSVMEEEADAHS